MSATPAFDEALHLTGIGSSSSAGCLGLSPYRTPLEEYERFVRALDGQPREANIDPEKAFFGHAMEPVIARAFERETGLKVRRNTRTFRSKQHPHLIATPDAFIIGHGAVLEFKTAGLRTIRMWGEEGTDEVPMHYLVQVAHQLAVLDYDRAQLAVLLGANDLRIYRIDRDPELERMMLARLAEFWRRVQERDPPPPTTLVDAQTRWKDAGTSILATPEVASAAAALQDRKAAIKALAAEAETLELAIKNHMGESSVLTAADGTVLATWKAVDSRRFDSKAFAAAHPDLYEQFRAVMTTRTFRLK